MTPERQALAEIARQAPDAQAAYGIDHKGPWARIGETTARARPPAVALSAVLQKTMETP